MNNSSILTALPTRIFPISPKALEKSPLGSRKSSANENVLYNY